MDIWDKLYAKASEVRNPRRISGYMTCGEVGAAILTRSGNIYTGICVDTCSTLGICAERNAMMNMLTNGESEIDKVVAVLPDGSVGAPCGACREFMMQLGEYNRNIEILMDLKTKRIVKLSDICPEWWIK